MLTLKHRLMTAAYWVFGGLIRRSLSNRSDQLTLRPRPAGSTLRSGAVRAVTPAATDVLMAIATMS